MDSLCSYRCTELGGCTVQYIGPIRDGATSGSCFPPAYGGSCIGTPQECDNCNKAIACQKIDAAIGSTNNDSGLKYPEPCKYACTNGGGCTVQYKGPSRSGATFGSCFPLSFGGGCSGTPPECRECKDAIKCSHQNEDTYKDKNTTISTVGGRNTDNDDERCIYLCTAGGGCKVRYATPAAKVVGVVDHRTGSQQGPSNVGKCFQGASGWKCSGTPNGCKDCSLVLQCEVG